MRWLLWLAVGYLVAMFVFVGVLSTLVHHVPISAAVVWSTDRQYGLEIDREYRLPFGLSGAGAHPGEVRAFDRFGRELDEQRVPDITKIRDITWTRYKVYFSLDEGSYLTRTSLDLIQ